MRAVERRASTKALISRSVAAGGEAFVSQNRAYFLSDPALTVQADHQGLPMAFPAQLAVPSYSEMRTARRRAVNFQAFVRETEARVASVEVTDLSTDGCRFASADAFETATMVWLKIAGLGARQARIIWYRGGVYGCEFLSPMQTDSLDDLLTGHAISVRGKSRAGSEGFGRAGV
jgi:hypothetical protein